MRVYTRTSRFIYIYVYIIIILNSHFIKKIKNLLRIKIIAVSFVCVCAIAVNVYKDKYNF
jgi:hypothetical protein